MIIKEKRMSKAQLVGMVVLLSVVGENLSVFVLHSRVGALIFTIGGIVLVIAILVWKRKAKS